MLYKAIILLNYYNRRKTKYYHACYTKNAYRPYAITHDQFRYSPSNTGCAVSIPVRNQCIKIKRKPLPRVLEQCKGIKRLPTLPRDLAPGKGKPHGCQRSPEFWHQVRASSIFQSLDAANIPQSSGKI